MAMLSYLRGQSRAHRGILSAMVHPSCRTLGKTTATVRAMTRTTSRRKFLVDNIMKLRRGMSFVKTPHDEEKVG